MDRVSVVCIYENLNVTGQQVYINFCVCVCLRVCVHVSQFESPIIAWISGRISIQVYFNIIGFFSVYVCK